MFRRRSEGGKDFRWHEARAPAIAVVSAIVSVFLIVRLSPERVNGLTVVLGIASVGAGFLVVGDNDAPSISASFIVSVLAAAFLGPASAALTAIIAELTATVRLKTRWRTTLLTNLPTAVVPAVVAALIVDSLSSGPSDTVWFYLAVALAGTVSMLLGFV